LGTFPTFTRDKSNGGFCQKLTVNVSPTHIPDRIWAEAAGPVGYPQPTARDPILAVERAVSRCWKLSFLGPLGANIWSTANETSPPFPAAVAK
jgi:hypothetical protein